MNIEYITDSDYMEIPERTLAQGSEKQLGPRLKCGNLSLVGNCTHHDCPCRSKQIIAQHDMAVNHGRSLPLPLIQPIMPA